MPHQPLIFVINLDSREDRMKKMAERLSGCKFVRISACTVAEVDSKYGSSVHSISLAKLHVRTVIWPL